MVRSSSFEFVLNLRAARALGVAVPPMLLARADEVIEEAHMSADWHKADIGLCAAHVCFCPKADILPWRKS